MMRWTEHNFARGGLRRWLQATGSLSARLAATGTVFSVQVIRQGRQPLTRSEAQALGLEGHAIGHAREVLLKVDGTPVVLARSVTTQPDSLGAWRAVRGLGSRPLADVLFRRSGITRQPLQYRQARPGTALRQQVGRAWQRAQSAAPGVPTALPAPSCATMLALPRSLPARRSVFVRRGAPLLVMEVFIAPRADWRWPGQSLRASHQRKLP
ncbi:chorismate lyase [Rhodoferax sp. 4810]|nr:chorismate lyase [Rhodoferax jenense]